jgi:hypothetical protein
MTPIVGKLYKTNAGEVVRIVKENKGLGWPFVASDGEHYDHEGKAYHGSYMDLKEEITV